LYHSKKEAPIGVVPGQYHGPGYGIIVEDIDYCWGYRQLVVVLFWKLGQVNGAILKKWQQADGALFKNPDLLVKQLHNCQYLING
jgi:hypothetical protein